jgi:DNA polymerase elongation subunit (family B)
MSFYTDAFVYKGKIHYRGIKNNKAHIKLSHNYSPYLFLEDSEGEFKTIKDVPVKKKIFNSIWDAKEFIKKYEGTNVTIYGMTEFQYTFLNDLFPKEIEYDTSLINIGYIDIETLQSLDISAPEPITAITLRCNGLSHVFGCGIFEHDSGDICYHHCENEEELLHTFLIIWQQLNLDIISGWNCIPINQNIWTKDSIQSILTAKDELYDSNILNRSPISYKEAYEIKLANGYKFKTSVDHRIPVITGNPENYTKLTFGHKEKMCHKVMTVNEIMNTDKTVFVEIPKRENKQEDNDKYSLNELYLAGLIYTDGTHRKSSYRFYQSDFQLMKELNYFGITSPINERKQKNKNHSVQYDRNIPKSFVNEAHHLIYNDKNIKNISVEKLSQLSERQFMAFLSGVLDGDGCNSGEKISFCNYNNDLDKFFELILWNGMFGNVYWTNKKGGNINLTHFKEDLLILRKNKRWKSTANTVLARDNSQKSSRTKFKLINDKWYVRIKNITPTKEIVEMMDIETDTNYFIASGIKVHNCKLFDIPYLFNRIKNILGERDALKLSPWKLVFEKVISSQGKECITFDVKGICILDYWELYKKFTFKNHESYRLDYIGHEELGEGKVDYSEYAGLLDLYYNNHQKFIEYNIRDVLIVEKLEEKLGFIALVIALAYDAKCNYIDVLTTIRPWDIIIHNYLLERGIVIPPMKQHIIPDNEVLFGGYVKEPKEGLHEWVESIDLTSLYPHLIMMYNIGPDTFIGRVNAYYEFEMNNVVLKNPPEKQNYCITANGCMYSRNKQGFMAALMESKFKNRKFFKKKMISAKKAGDKKGEILFHNKQYAMKIQLNSLFGSLLNIHNRWFDFNNGNAITTTGQLVAKYINNVLNIFLNEFFKTVNIDYIVAQDTDSAYICLDKLAKQYPEKERKELVKIIVEFVENKILTYLEERFKHFAEVTNAREQKLDMKLEKVSNRALFTTKKRYVLNALYDEGVYYDEPKLEIKGLEAVRSSTPQVCREQLKKSLSIIMNENEKSLHKAVKTFKETFFSLPFEDIASPRSANGIDKYQDNETIYKKGTPIHVRGSLLYNKLLKKYNIKNTQPVQNGDKIKFIYLKNPNPLHENVIASPGTLPKEFGLEKYIDRNLQFKKVFLEPLQGITRIINWEVIPTVRLSEFYKN